MRRFVLLDWTPFRQRGGWRVPFCITQGGTMRPSNRLTSALSWIPLSPSPNGRLQFLWRNKGQKMESQVWKKRFVQRQKVNFFLGL